MTIDDRVYQFSKMLAQILVKKYREGGRASIGVIAPTNKILAKFWKVFRGTPGNFQDTYLQTQNSGHFPTNGFIEVVH